MFTGMERNPHRVTNLLTQLTCPLQTMNSSPHAQTWSIDNIRPTMGCYTACDIQDKNTKNDT